MIATRQLRQEGVPVNFTLGFSARHNYLAAAFARPSYVNVFLGRLNAYVETHGLGDGSLVGDDIVFANTVTALDQVRYATRNVDGAAFLPSQFGHVIVRHYVDPEPTATPDADAPDFCP